MRRLSARLGRWFQVVVADVSARRQVSGLAQEIVSNGMIRTMPGHRVQFLRELITHAAAALELMEGAEIAAEHVYRIADIVAAGDHRKPKS